MELDPEIARIADILRRIADLLRDYGDLFWTDKIERCRLAIENSDELGAREFLGYFGGMGSLNDLVLGRGNNFYTDENDELHALMSEAWGLATSSLK